jgi:protein-serine/threonine kinase
MKPGPGSEVSIDQTNPLAPLRVVNGMPSTLTTTTVSPDTIRSSPPLASPTLDGTPSIAHPYNPAGISTAPSAWTSKILPPPGLAAHEEEEGSDGEDSDENNQSIDPWARRRAAALHPQVPTQPRKITPSLKTLERAVSAKIYFENLYFPLLRQKPSREKRRLAMEKEMEQLGMSEGQKNVLRERWRQNETDYLRQQRAKVDVNAFIKLKTIGHGM